MLEDIGNPSDLDPNDLPDLNGLHLASDIIEEHIDGIEHTAKHRPEVMPIDDDTQRTLDRIERTAHALAEGFDPLSPSFTIFGKERELRIPVVTGVAYTAGYDIDDIHRNRLDKLNDKLETSIEELRDDPDAWLAVIALEEIHEKVETVVESEGPGHENAAFDKHYKPSVFRE